MCYREASRLFGESETGGVSGWISSCRKPDRYEDYSPWLARLEKAFQNPGEHASF
jgi:hypothetical protein